MTNITAAELLAHYLDMNKIPSLPLGEQIIALGRLTNALNKENFNTNDLISAFASSKTIRDALGLGVEATDPSFVGEVTSSLVTKSSEVHTSAVAKKESGEDIDISLISPIAQEAVDKRLEDAGGEEPTDPEEPEEPEEPDTGDTGSLTTLLEELGTLNGNKKAFLEAGEYTGDAAVTAAKGTAEAAVDTAMGAANGASGINDTGAGSVTALLGGVPKTNDYAGKSDGVKAALEADAQEALTKALAKANENVTAAETAIEKVTGLAAAIALEEAAGAARVAADIAADTAAADLAGAKAAFAAINTATGEKFVGADTDVTTSNDVYVKDGKLYEAVANSADIAADTLIATKGSNGWTVETGVTIKNITQVLAAYESDVAAQADAAQKAAALADAQAEVSYLDLKDASAVTALETVGAGFTETTPADADKPTLAEIKAELAALKVKGDAAVTTQADAGELDFDDAAGLYIGSELNNSADAKAYNTFQALVTAFDSANNSNPLAEALADAKADVETVEGFQTALDEAIAGYETAKADADTLAKFNDDIAQVEANIADAGYKLQAAGATSNDSDVILFNNLSDNDTITGFGAKFTEGQADYLMIGDYTLVKTEIETVGATTKFGNSADALEVFAVQTSAGVDLYFEKEEAAGNLNYVAGNFTKITLAGLTNDDLNFANGIIEAAL